MALRTRAELDDHSKLLAVARELGDRFAANASEVDEAGVFPAANMRRLRESGLLGLLVPRAYGGLGLGLTELVEIGQILGGACTSTAMLWAMHCQQVATLVRHGHPTLLDRVLPDVAAGNCLLASITTEAGKGGHLMSAFAPLTTDSNRLHVERDAPVVSAGMEADAYLVTMRSSPDSPSNDVTLAFVSRDAAEVEFRSGWSTMGMRGTASVGIRLAADLRADELVNGIGGFSAVAITTLVPVGHLAWSSVWLGAARRAFEGVIALLRNPKSRSGVDVASDLAAHNLARIRLRLDTLSAFLWSCLEEYLALDSHESGSLARYEDVPFQLHINGLKVLASETAFEVVNELISVVGLRHGYTRSEEAQLERTFRDLRSAALMYANDRLLVANGKMALFDRRVRLLGERDDNETNAMFFGPSTREG